MDAVLGLSVTPSAVGLVLVEGQDADGATMDRDAFEIGHRRSSALQTSEQAASAVLRSEAVAVARGHRLHSIGVTWSEDADTEASLVLKSLTDSGFDNVVPVRLPEATEALAWGIAEVIGYETTAVCVIEPETVITLIVHTRDGAVQTAVNQSIHSEERLIRWLSALFTRADWQPEALVVVGSGGDLEALMPRLEHVLAVPVFAPAEAELALARGAALASAHNTEFGYADDEHVIRGHRAQHRVRRPMAQTGPLALLVAGVLTFVVSLSVAISLQLAPKKDSRPPEARPAAKTSPDTPAGVDHIPPALPPPAAIPVPAAQTPIPPPAAAPPVEVAPTPVEVPVDAPVSVPEAPALVSDAPPADLPAPVDPAPLEPGMVAPPIAPPPPLPEQLAPPPVAPEPVERPGILRRIKDRLSNIGPDDQVQPGETLPPAPPVPLTELPPPPEGPPPEPLPPEPPVLLPPP